ncbi:MAG: lysozyme inhibitor LprI family protein [Sphingomonas sp.]|uniref:lysozyme inhibitor LprI family protein n=1 Tax=unclassified Sphingomonas TaxID=196159 RepID=UPI000F872999|nr:lysozyme inhibitor LprI family protein [Sphingomonas sp. TF3]RUN76813.1 DUF1311 domain-containing protein [Sphingomonas sp. TF3]
MLPLFALVLAAASPTGKELCPGTTTLEVNACQKAKFDQADANLNRYYEAALKRLQGDDEPKVRQELVKSQRDWIIYRDAECGAVFDNWSGGTIRVSMEIGCKTQLTQLRTYSIWKNWLTYMDSTPPVLPRPAIELSVAAR